MKQLLILLAVACLSNLAYGYDADGYTQMTATVQAPRFGGPGGFYQGTGVLYNNLVQAIQTKLLDVDGNGYTLFNVPTDYTPTGAFIRVNWGSTYSGFIPIIEGANYLKWVSSSSSLVIQPRYNMTIHWIGFGTPPTGTWDPTWHINDRHDDDNNGVPNTLDWGDRNTVFGANYYTETGGIYSHFTNGFALSDPNGYRYYVDFYIGIFMDYPYVQHYQTNWIAFEPLSTMQLHFDVVWGGTPPYLNLTKRP